MASNTDGNIPNFQPPATFLERVRYETSYPTLRKVIEFLAAISILGFLIAILLWLVNSSRVSTGEAVLNLVFLVLGIILTIAGKQATILFVDIADILIWKGKRQMWDEK